MCVQPRIMGHGYVYHGTFLYNCDLVPYIMAVIHAIPIYAIGIWLKTIPMKGFNYCQKRLRKTQI